MNHHSITIFSVAAVLTTTSIANNDFNTPHPVSLKNSIYTWIEKKKSISWQQAQLVLCFSDQPTIAVEQKKESLITEKKQFVFHNIVTDISKIKALQKEVAGNPHSDYLISIAMHEQDLDVTITYNPQQVDVLYEAFDSIRQDRCYAIKVFDKKSLQIKEKPPIYLAQTTRSPTIIVDCGHGGADTGAISTSGIAEKDVCLAIGLYTAQFLNDYGIATVLTRKDDRSCTLAHRINTTWNTAADACISIHANSVSDKKISGIETFYTSAYAITPYGHSLVPFFKQCCVTSKILAHYVHEQTVATVSPYYCVQNRGLKSGVPNLLYGSPIPAILIEVGFLSHPNESTKIAEPFYQKLLARGISSGVIVFLNTSL